MNEHSKKLESLDHFSLYIPRVNNATENRPVTVVMAKPRARTPSSAMHLRFDSSQTRFQDIQPA
ncbi:hypothetical protein [Pseudomonas sp. PLMAX]|uniref:hypothetical protein n=1 Tax=Pseudomonas sp. PLMAX TaxID=2201998 RepID=UPI0038BC97CD